MCGQGRKEGGIVVVCIYARSYYGWEFLGV